MKTEGNPRRVWSNKWELLSALIANSTGLGTLFRFPFACYYHGGATFILPYLVMLMLIGKPLFFLESVLGQFSGEGSIKTYRKIAPAWIGIGISQMLICFVVSSYKAYLLALYAFYLVHSFSFTLPWNQCQKEWGKQCVPSEVFAQESNATHLNGSINSAKLFFTNYVMESQAISMRGIDWRTAFALMTVWSIITANLMFGVKSYGKISYLYSIFPYFLLLCLLIRALSLPRSFQNLVHLIKPDMKKLLTIDHWISAAFQVFLSLGISYGTISTSTSYNTIHVNLLTTTNIVLTFATTISVTMSIILFCTTGDMSTLMNTDTDLILDKRLQTAFVVYTTAIAGFEVASYVYAIMFFTTYLLVGIGQVTGMQQVIVANILELYPTMREYQANIIIFVIGISSSLIYSTKDGLLAFRKVDVYGHMYIRSVITIFQIIALIYAYDFQKLCWQIEYMLKRKVSAYYRYTLAVITPASVIVMLSLMIYEVYQQEEYISNLNLIIFALLNLPIPVSIIWDLITNRHEKNGTCKVSFGKRTLWPLNDKDADKAKAFVEMQSKEYRYKTLGIVKFFKTLIGKSSR